MNAQQPIIEQIQNSIPSTGAISEGLATASSSITENLSNVKQSVQSNLGDFSSKGVMNASSEFLESNGLLAKSGFIILVLIVFLYLFKIGVGILSYLMGPAKNPYVVYGKLDGNTGVIIPQDPANNSAVTIVRSNNKTTGAEFTWSVWLFLNMPNSTSSPTNKTIFAKGTNDSSGFSDGFYQLNGPGMYVSSADGSTKLTLLCDDVQGNQNKIDIDNIPLQKWVHVAYRLQNTVLDVYINGTIESRKQMAAAPKQNYYDVNVCTNGGFPGSLSNLRYFDHALNVFDINNIVMFGPNTSPSALSADSKSVGGYTYLSRQWYNSN